MRLYKEMTKNYEKKIRWVFFSPIYVRTVNPVYLRRIKVNAQQIENESNRNLSQIFMIP